MSAYPEVTVAELRGTEQETPESKPLDLGAHGVAEKLIEANAQNLLDASRALCERRFELTWNGSKIPRGAVVAGHAIGWTQHGRVLTDAGRDIGTYERVVEYGGPARDEQRMIVALYPEATP